MILTRGRERHQKSQYLDTHQKMKFRIVVGKARRRTENNERPLNPFTLIQDQITKPNKKDSKNYNQTSKKHSNPINTILPWSTIKKLKRNPQHWKTEAIDKIDW